ncbi:TetR/AcrR family transcriptional regulator [Streptomyces sp. ODS28]|uniref:TetR/AcrR family transcriptional regulator n=1 Tax=Streptomyces sp. ODS28 TaxID=3136688 RepID=UPI0031F083FC
MPRTRVLEAADALFAEAGASDAVSMDAIAAAAGIGKGTLFRAFGSRDKLLDALFAMRMGALREAIETGPAPLGPDTPPRERILGIMDAALTFKLDNRPLIQAREVTAGGLLQADHYRWMHHTLRDLIERAAADTSPTGTSSTGAPEADPGYAAHILLGALRPDLIDELLASGETPETLRAAQADLARRLLD